MISYESAQNDLINLYVDIVVEDALETINMIDGQYVKDVCMANIQNEIDFSDVEEQIKRECDVIIRKELEKLLSNLAL